jgi:hypothetical protein
MTLCEHEFSDNSQRICTFSDLRIAGHCVDGVDDGAFPMLVAVLIILSFISNHSVPWRTRHSSWTSHRRPCLTPMSRTFGNSSKPLEKNWRGVCRRMQGLVRSGTVISCLLHL